MRPVLPVMLVVALLALPARAGTPQVGKLHPEIRLPTLDGRDTVSLRAQIPHKVLLIQFASW